MQKQILSVATGLLTTSLYVVSGCSSDAGSVDALSIAPSTTSSSGFGGSTTTGTTVVSTTDGATTAAVATTTTDGTTTTAVATTTTDGTTSSAVASTTDGTTSTTGEVEPEPEVNLSGGPGQCPESWGGSNDGSLTWYTFSQGTVNVGDVNCSFGIQQGPDRVNHIYTGNGEFFGAMNTADYNTAAACGACVEVTRQDTGQHVVVTIVDQCPIATNSKCVP